MLEPRRAVRRLATLAASVATFAALGVAVGAGSAAAATTPPGCPAHDVSQYPMYYDYYNQVSLGGGLYQRFYHSYYLGTKLKDVNCTHVG